MNTVLILGAGRFGSALAIALAQSNHKIHLLCRDDETIASFREKHSLLLQGSDQETLNSIELLSLHSFPSIRPNFIIQTIPAPLLETFYLSRKNALIHTEFWREVPILFTSRGTTTKGELTHEVMQRIWQKSTMQKFYYLAGAVVPHELLLKKPSVFLVAGENKEGAQKIAHLLTDHSKQRYADTTLDWCGVAICGVVRNLISMYAGYVCLRWNSQNALCGLLSRILHESQLLLEFLSCNKTTALGPAGLSDFLLHTTSSQSVTFSIGNKMGEGIHPLVLFERYGKDLAQKGAGTAAEGISCLLGLHLIINRLPETEQNALPVLRGIISALRYERKPEELNEWILNPLITKYKAPCTSSVTKRAPVVTHVEKLMQHISAPTEQTKKDVDDIKVQTRPAPLAMRNFFSRTQWN